MTSASTESADTTLSDPIAHDRVDKFAQRRAELAQAAVVTLSERGYARTSLREIAQNSAFSHGVLHYYFKDKLDLITCCVWQFKERCVARYGQVTAGEESFDALLDGFVLALAASVREEAHLHRLWYDIRTEAMFEPAFRRDIAAIDQSLEAMVWRILERLHIIRGATPAISPSLAYAVLDGIFQHCLIKHLTGDPKAIDAMSVQVRSIIAHILPARSDRKSMKV